MILEHSTCGQSSFDQQQMQPFYVHQHIELPKIKMNVSHFILQECDCPNCGKKVKAMLPAEKATGYGPRFTALIGELSGNKAMSRNDVKQLCESVLDVSIATGTIQKIIDRTSEAICPVYSHIGRVARSFPVRSHHASSAREYLSTPRSRPVSPATQTTRRPKGLSCFRNSNT